MPPCHGEQRAMLQRENFSSNGKYRKPIIYFIIGFIISTAFAFIAYGLSLGIFSLFEVLWEDPLTPESCEKRILGHYDLHAVGELTESQISKLTHLVFFPIVLHASGTLGFKNYEQKQRFKISMRKAKLFSVKTMFTVWDENANYEIIEDVMEDADKRLTLLTSITNFVKTHNLDGVDVYWRWSETEQESVHFMKFCKELRGQLQNKIFSITFAPHRKHYSTDFQEIWKYVNFMSIDTNNYYGSWLPRNRNLVGPSSPLFSGHGKFKNQNLGETMRYYSCVTRKPHRFNIMVEFAGRFWNNVNVNSSDSSILWPISEPQNGQIGGGAAFYGDLKSHGWNISDASWNDESKTPYIWKPLEKSYLTFDNERSLGKKIRYLIE